MAYRWTRRRVITIAVAMLVIGRDRWNRHDALHQEERRIEHAQTVTLEFTPADLTRVE
jgi:hypothetical protein